jgi:hypothetical protein
MESYFHSVTKPILSGQLWCVSISRKASMPSTPSTVLDGLITTIHAIAV